MSLIWRGGEIQKKIQQAARRGIDETLARCVPIAKANTPVRTGTAQGSIKFEPAIVKGNRVVGRWGSFNVRYFIWLEIGARGKPGRHMLRSAAAREYPQLKARIKKYFEKAS